MRIFMTSMVSVLIFAACGGSGGYDGYTEADREVALVAWEAYPDKDADCPGLEMIDKSEMRQLMVDLNDSGLAQTDEGSWADVGITPTTPQLLAFVDLAYEHCN